MLGISLGVYLSCSLVIVSELIWSKILETFLILSAILLPMKSPVARAVFRVTLRDRNGNIAF